MTINIFMYIYIGENAHWDIYAPPLANHYTKKNFNIFYYFFSFQMYIVTNKSQKMFSYKYFYTRALRG